MIKWDKKTIKKFHENRHGPYAGDTVAEVILSLSKKYIGNRVLDAGAGSGAIINLLPEAIGIDLVSKHKRMLEGDISNLPFINCSFDTIFATEVLEHLDDSTLDKCLDEIHRVLADEGHLIITVPYNENLTLNQVYCPKCGECFHKVGHQQSFDELRMEELLSSKKFSPIKIKVLPLGLIATHTNLKQIWIILQKLGYIKSNNLFIICTKK